MKGLDEINDEDRDEDDANEEKDNSAMPKDRALM